MEKDEFFIKRIRELANLSYQRDIVTFSDFLNLNEQNIINDRKNQMPGVVMECFGGYEQAERQMVAFHPDALLFPWKYPIKCLKAEPLAAKFSEDLTHRDFLGAVLNLGIERAVIGDILVQKHTAWIFCHEKIADTLVDNSTVVLNLEGLDMELAQRIIDFTSGACYSLGGSLQKVSSYIFILGPYNVDITGDLQNILGSNPVPSVRAGY